MPYAHRPNILDADSHLMEGLTWLRDHADPAARELLPDLTRALDKGGAGAGKAIQAGEARIKNVEKTEELAEDVIASAKGWYALGAMDTGERKRAMDLLGFEAQFVFSTFSVGLFAFDENPDVVYGGTTAHNRMMSEFCGDDDRLIGVGFLPLNDTDRSLDALSELLDLGCRAVWMAHAPSAGKTPSHVDHDPVWAALSDAGIPALLHIGAGKNNVGKKWHNNGLPRPTDLHGGGENLRAKDLPSVHHAAETWLTAMVLDGVFDRFPELHCGVIEMGASWVPSLMARLDYAAKSFARTEPTIAGLELKPSEYLERQVRFTPFPGEDVGQMIAQSSPELYLFSSDYPHPEGTKDPIGKFEHSLDKAGIDAAGRQLFYEDNMRTLVGA